MTFRNRVWRLQRRPVGDVSNDDLSFGEEAVPEPAEGEFLIRTMYLSLDPTNRIWMSDMDQYMEPVGLGEPMRGVVCGRVVSSRHEGYAEGDIVSGIGIWADYQLGRGGEFGKLQESGPVPLSDAFGLFAVVGPTAYFGLLDIGRPEAGETVVVSAAAGAVGSIVGQIAKIQGCRAVGLAGSDEKCRWIEELGYDAAINYKSEDIHESLQRHCPDGIDVYFDNTGGVILDTVLRLINLRARIVTCGLIASYNATAPVPGPYNYGKILMQRARVEGFVVLDYFERFPEAILALSRWMGEGRLKFRTDVVDGLENALDTMRKLYSGDHRGKLLVRVSEES